MSLYFSIYTGNVCVAAMRIHITEQTKQALDQLGGYIVELRGQLEIKVKLLFAQIRAHNNRIGVVERRQNDVRRTSL